MRTSRGVAVTGEVEQEVAESDWCFRTNQPVRQLFDHLAEELAAEYVRLVKTTREKEGER